MGEPGQLADLKKEGQWRHKWNTLERNSRGANEDNSSTTVRTSSVDRRIIQRVTPSTAGTFHTAEGAAVR